MSSANAAAKKRRAPADPPTQNKLQPAMQPVGQGINQSMNSPGLTLPQVISVIDKRLITLETFMVESKRTVQFSNLPTPPTTMNQPSPSMDEFNSRFEILANEIANMKNIILSLQTYTSQYFQESVFKQTQKRQVVGQLIRAETTLQSVLAERLLVKALIFSLLTIHTQNKRQP